MMTLAFGLAAILWFSAALLIGHAFGVDAALPLAFLGSVCTLFYLIDSVGLWAAALARNDRDVS